MKITQLLLLLSLALLALADGPPECDKYDCPTYTVLSQNQTASVEIRQYNAARWVRTKIEAISYEEATSEGFNRLFDYISGQNVDNKHIEMTAPVTVQVLPIESGPWCKSNFVVSFFVPPEYQPPNPAPPAPSSDNVFIQTLPETTKAVYMFPGYVTSWSDLVGPITALTNYCDDNNLSYIPNVETIVGYDSPFVLQHRHNEIWRDVKMN